TSGQSRNLWGLFPRAFGEYVVDRFFFGRSAVDLVVVLFFALEPVQRLVPRFDRFVVRRGRSRRLFLRRRVGRGGGRGAARSAARPVVRGRVDHSAVERAVAGGSRLGSGRRLRRARVVIGVDTEACRRSGVVHLSGVRLSFRTRFAVVRQQAA